MNVGNLLAAKDVIVDGELRAPDLVAGRVPERRPLSEPAAETEGGREEKPDSEGQTLSATLGVWLAELVVLRASDADCCVGGCGETCGPLLRPLEITLAGGVG
jgi:hypothetical protein